MYVYDVITGGNGVGTELNCSAMSRRFQNVLKHVST